MIIKPRKKENKSAALVKKLFASKSIILYISIVIFFSLCSFVLGVDLHRKGIINADLREYLSTASKIPQKYIKSLFTNVNTIYIDMDYKNFQKIAYQRHIALQKGLHVSSEAEYVSAAITYNNEQIEVKLKLKGAHSDHWRDDEKWSLKVKIKDDQTIEGMKEFSLMPPVSRGYIYEWIYQKLLKDEGFIYKRIHFIRVAINGKSNGIYILEEELDDALLINNQLDRSPIVSFDKKLWTKESIKRSSYFSLHGNVDFHNFPVKSELSYDVNDKDLTAAIMLVNKFRNGTAKLNEVFEISRIAKFFALRALLLSKEFDRKDLTFYYEPNTGKLEPIGGEVHHTKPHVGGWWINELPDISGNKDLLSLFFDDPIFYQEYYLALSKLVDRNYLDGFFSRHENEMNNMLNILNKEFYDVNTFDKNLIYSNQKFMKTIMYPLEGVQSYFESSTDNELVLYIGNICSWPVSIIDADIGGQQISLFQGNNTYLDPKKDGEPVSFVKYVFLTDSLFEPNKDSIRKININYVILGSNEVQSAKVYPYKQYDFTYE